MINRVRQTIEKYKMLNVGDGVIVALSGGADSVTLLSILNSIKESYNLTLYAAHLNHGIRGEEAERDESFCKVLCEKYKIQFFAKRLDIPRLAAERKISLELCGREERYKLFSELSEELGAKIATAHTASDNAETLIFNLARGSSLNGATGISPVRGHIIRPLIGVSRNEIEAYCAEKGLDFVTDSSNLSDEYTRNKIRHSVIPVLKLLNPSVENAALRFCESASEASDYIAKQAQRLIEETKTEFGFDCEKLCAAHPALLHSAIALLCRQNADFLAEYRHIELIEGIIKCGGAVELNKNVTAVSAQGLLRFCSLTESGEAFEANPDYDFFGKTEFLFKGNKYLFDIKNGVELSKIKIRTRQSGDIFTFDGRNITKPLRKAMNENKLPREIRDRLVLVADGKTVLWCEKLGYSREGSIFKREKGLCIKIIDSKGAEYNA